LFGINFFYKVLLQVVVIQWSDTIIPMNEEKTIPMKKDGLALLFIIGAAALTIRTLLDSNFGKGTLLYLLVPFAISIALTRFTHRSARPGRWWDYLNHIRFATIIFFATSALLFEGFICVLMFMPIYYALVTIGYIFAALLDRGKEEGGNRLGVYALPTLVMILASEGLLPATTVPRDRTATYVTVTDQNIETLKHNMASPIAFPAERYWFLRIFPLPDRIDAGSLGVGDVHRLHFTYKKWFFANYSEGEMLIRIAEVAPQHIRTEITRNTSYLSHYMKINGTDVRFTPLAGGRTRVALTVKYHRLLDPSWYFGPMQQLAAEQSARYLVDTIIVRAPSQETE
jgi:hypothetical protein